jgi:hypothetical protein
MRWFEEAFPFAAYVRNRKTLLAQANAPDLFEQKPELLRYRELSEQQLTDRLKDERTRAAAMDDKTFKVTLSLTVGLTIVGTTSATLVSMVNSPTLKTVTVAALAAAVGYILGAGFLAIGALRTEPSFGYGTGPLLAAPEKQRTNYAEYLARQEIMNQTRQVRNEASYQAIRNGLALFLAVTALAAGARIFSL